ncbi:sulfoxide reductase heme-binding subunit YedZ [Candidatus Persebacteraceae bacterium Df01]|jgi:sulfoxide reductase heme-binding subunit YedZ|uniref:Protein-methionine-sulfoxide reductase heme-binding subunit MsrQ n=1 Tax=Candidatus Doriopsillibacter californiensis TaxID=2970740 RepID=A0ABT7QM39_9GAMM|nr:sulfoxide reductase heme-binding subunit YedZ [Candidatus Persebacteraceae bacterium Df01]
MPVAQSLSPQRFNLLKGTLFIVSLAPLAAITYAVLSGNITEPVEFITRETGEHALHFLIIILLMTPLRQITRWNSPIKLRRMFGLFAFFYVFCHFCTYLFLDLQLDFSLVVDDIIKRKYITVGFVAFLLLLPLAITSNRFSIKKMGSKRWTSLHKSIYLIALLGPLHFLWLERGEDLSEPLTYLVIMIALLALRAPSLRARITRTRKVS